MKQFDAAAGKAYEGGWNEFAWKTGDALKPISATWMFTGQTIRLKKEQGVAGETYS